VAAIDPNAITVVIADKRRLFIIGVPENAMNMGIVAEAAQAGQGVL
jgi:hypothetical protein